MTESMIMRMILNSKHNIPNNNILCEPNARNTVHNFYYCLYLLYQKQITQLKNFMIVTSDFHVERSKTFFNILSENIKLFNCNNIQFIGVVLLIKRTKRIGRV